MEKRKLKNWEIENIEDLIPSVEEMFQIKFQSEELINVSDFEELCKVISDKIQLQDIDSCTKQQTFYKLRKALDKLKIIDKDSLTLKSRLEEFLPRKTRKKNIQKIENELGFKTDLIEAPELLTKALFYGLLVSLIMLFIKWQIGFIGVVIFILSLMITIKSENELKVKTVRELVELLTRENYLKVRSEEGTINRKELKGIIADWFSDMLEMKKEELLNTRFI